MPPCGHNMLMVSVQRTAIYCATVLGLWDLLTLNICSHRRDLVTICARIHKQVHCRKTRLMIENFYVEYSSSDNAFDESEKAEVEFSHATPETDLDAYDELEALDEMIVGM